MNPTSIERPRLGVRLLHRLVHEPNWSTMTAEEVAASGDAATRKAASPLARVIIGLQDRRAEIRRRTVTLPDRALRVRAYRPAPRRDNRADLRQVLRVHGGGGFMGSAVQSDWLNSHLAARLPAVVVSVEHRLLAPGLPLLAMVDDGWDALRHNARHAAKWEIDAAQISAVGESASALVVALIPIRARQAGLRLRATHAYLSLPRVVPRAATARAEIAECPRACVCPAGTTTACELRPADAA
jgi:acetyl esterase